MDGFDAGRERRIEGWACSLARFRVPGQVSCLEAQAELNVFEPMLHSSLELLYTHLVPRLSIQCRPSIAMPVLASLLSLLSLMKIEPSARRPYKTQ